MAGDGRERYQRAALRSPVGFRFPLSQNVVVRAIMDKPVGRSGNHEDPEVESGGPRCPQTQ